MYVIVSRSRERVSFHQRLLNALYLSLKFLQKTQKTLGDVARFDKKILTSQVAGNDKAGDQDRYARLAGILSWRIAGRQYVGLSEKETVYEAILKSISYVLQVYIYLQFYTQRQMPSPGFISDSYHHPF